MKSFRFNLQVLLALRQREERAAMERYAQTLVVRQHASEALTAVSRELADAWLRRSRELMEGCRAGDVSQSHGHCQQLDAERRQHEAAVATAERSAERALGELLAARLAREVVEKHRAHQRAEFDRSVNRAEQRFLDDLATQRRDPAMTWQAARAN